MVVTDLKPKDVFLLPKPNMLNSVNVNSTAAPSSFRFYDLMFHGQTIIYQRDANLQPKGGVIFRLWYWKKDGKRKASQEKALADEQLREKIALKFSAKTIGSLVPLKGIELDNFIALYTPDVKIYKINDFNLLNYVDECYKKFIKLPADKRRLPKLND